MQTFYTVAETNNDRHDADLWDRAFPTMAAAKIAVLCTWEDDAEIVEGVWVGSETQQILRTDDSVVWITKTTVG